MKLRPCRQGNRRLDLEVALCAGASACSSHHRLRHRRRRGNLRLRPLLGLGLRLKHPTRPLTWPTLRLPTLVSLRRRRCCTVLTRLMALLLSLYRWVPRGPTRHPHLGHLFCLVSAKLLLPLPKIGIRLR